jgi:hypothetical protein
MDAYGKDVLRNLKLYVVERRTEVFKMHFDLDFKKAHDDETLEALLEAIQGCVLRFLEPGLREESWCIACAVHDDGARKAPGVHLVFPWLLVDAAKARWMRSAVVNALNARFGALEASWEAAVDEAVFMANGLRMVGSDKCRDCAVCRNEREARPFCGACSRQGRVPEDKVYWPWKAFPPGLTEGLCQDAKANRPYGVRMCSTRVPSSRQHATPRFRAPPEAPPQTLARAEAGAQLRPQAVHLTPELQVALRETLASHHGAYSALQPISLERFASASFRLRVRGEGSRYCQNKQGEHAQQTVYFILNKEGVAQRCYSRKAIVRHAGLCAHYASAASVLLPALLGLLFPRGANKRKDDRKEANAASSKRRDNGLLLAQSMWGFGSKHLE